MKTIFLKVFLPLWFVASRFLQLVSTKSDLPATLVGKTFLLQQNIDQGTKSIMKQWHMCTVNTLIAFLYFVMNSKNAIFNHNMRVKLIIFWLILNISINF